VIAEAPAPAEAKALCAAVGELLTSLC
jgi:hypothetical protein